MREIRGMMVRERIFKLFVGMGAAILLGPSVNCLAGEEADAGRALVMTDGLPVYARASLESTAVASLARGEAVSVKVEMLGAGADGPWCGIAVAGETRVAGFVQCEHLERGSGREEEWQLLGAASASQPAARVTAVIIRGNRVLVPVVLRNGWKKQEILLVLDTGAYKTVIHSDVASMLHIDMGRAKEGLARVADGSVVSTRHIRIDDLRVGPHLLNDMEISIMDYNGPPDYGGLLGMDVLRGLRYRIDFEKQQIVWQ